MHKLLTGLAVISALITGIPANGQANPFVGRWDFNVQTPEGPRANWLGISEKGGKLEVWFQPTGGHVFQVKDVKAEGSHLSLGLTPASGNHPAMTWDLDATDGRLKGVQKQGESSTELTGVRAPDLNRKPPKAWTNPEPLFNGKDLSGWEPIGDKANSHWVVKDGVLLNEAHGANLKSTRRFDDFKVHFEVNCPTKANSGFYLRGRYEVQLEYEAEATEPPERSMGAIYGRIAPSKELLRTPGQWETFDITFIGRTVTIMRNGQTIIDHKQVDGITGGALDANEGEPGPFYIQGDHTGGLQFRNITVSTPKS